MFGNNFGYPFMGGMPNQMISPMTRNMMGPAMSPLNRGISQGRSLRSLLGLGRTTSPGGLTSRGFSFSNLLNGASKTLGVVRDAIPVVKEIGPMMNNMKSMLKIASVFKDETDTKEKKEETSSNINNNDQNNSTNKEKTDYSYNQSNNSPNFFL